VLLVRVLLHHTALRMLSVTNTKCNEYAIEIFFIMRQIFRLLMNIRKKGIFIR
jgi:hypothetical protein